MGYEERTGQNDFLQFAGLNTRDSELALPAGDSPQLLNVDLHPKGAIRSRNGCSLWSLPDGNKDVAAVMRLNIPESARGWIYVVTDDTLWRTAYPGTIAWQEPTHASGYTMDKSSATTAWGRALGRYFDGTTEYPVVLYIPRSNGAPLIALGQVSATGDIVNIPAAAYGSASPGTGTPGYPDSSSADDDHPEWKANHWPTKMRAIALGRGSRMHAWGFADERNMVAYSAMDEHWNFVKFNVDYPAVDAVPEVDGGYYVINPGDGDEIISVVDMFAYTVIFKRHNTYIYTGDPGSSDWSIAAHYPVGCVSDRAWEKVGNDLIFWSEDGPRALSAVQEYGDLAQSDLSFKISPSVKSIVPGSYERICSYHDIENQRIIWFVPLAASAYNDTAFVYYYNSREWTKWDGTYCQVNDVEVVKSTSTNDEAILAGTYDEGIVSLQKTWSDLDGNSVAKEYVTNWISFGTISDISRVLWLDVFFGDDGTNVDIEYQVDLNAEWSSIDRLAASYGQQGSSWGRLTWGTDAWGVTGRAHRRFEVDAVFDMIRFRFSATSELGFEIMGYRLESRLKGPRT
jgi:hypothetical protein